jgi:lipopolysaccharide export system permease protein
VFGNILQRMVFKELGKVFVMSLVGITGILLMAGIIAEASQQGLGPGQILAAIPLLIPSTLPYTIPATTLFATCVVYGRLAADNEIQAIKSAGVNVLLVVKPALFLGVAMSATTMGLYYHIIPRTHHLLRALVFNDAEELIYSILKKQLFIKYSQSPYEMYVKGVQGRKLINPVFKRKDKTGKYDIVVSAREADLRVDVNQGLLLINMHYGVGSSEGGDRGYFDHKVIEMEFKHFGKENIRRPRDMTWMEMIERKQELEEMQATKIAQASAETGKHLMTGTAHALRKQVKDLNNQAKLHQQQILQINVEMLMRPALSLGCLCFILVGCPVGILLSRSDYLSAFIICFLPIVFLYYPLLLAGTNMAKEGRYNPVALVWGANVVITLIGLSLYRRLLRN